MHSLQGSLLKPSAPGLSTGFGMGSAYPKPLKAEGNPAGTLDLSSHSSKPFQQPYGLPGLPTSGLGGIETYRFAKDDHSGSKGSLLNKIWFFF